MLAAVCTWSGRRLLDATSRASIVLPTNALLFVCYTEPRHSGVDRIRGRALAPRIFGRGTGAVY